MYQTAGTSGQKTQGGGDEEPREGGVVIAEGGDSGVLKDNDYDDNMDMDNRENDDDEEKEKPPAKSSTLIRLRKRKLELEVAKLEDEAEDRAVERRRRAQQHDLDQRLKEAQIRLADKQAAYYDLQNKRLRREH